MEQKIVIKVEMNCQKCKSRALQIAAVAYGVGSVALDGEDKTKLVVIGVNVDAVSLTSCLRKKVGYAEIEIIEEVKPVEKEKEKPKEKEKEKEKPKEKEKEDEFKIVPINYFDQYWNPPRWSYYHYY